LEQLRVAASERDQSLADKFAADLEAHVAAQDAAEDSTETDTETDAAIETEIETEDEAQSEAKADAAAAGAADADHRLVFEALQALEYRSASVTSGAKHTLRSEKTRWSSCLSNSDRAAGVTTLSAVAFKAAPPLRDQAFVVNIDGLYKGPDVTYGSVTLQIARSNAVGGPELVYRHSIVLSDVVMPDPPGPFRSGPLSTTMYVPNSAFNLMAKEGDYALSVTFTNQYKEPFACAKLEFRLD